jgi:uncharacterized protein (DUF952 family)/ribosomal protein S18 acetylase RimI-like enzyme
MLIVHAIRQPEWETVRHAPTYCALSLAKQGFIHCSESRQMVSVADSVFHGMNDLMLLCIDSERVESRVVWEAIGTKERFPHIYGPLNLDAVVDVVGFPCDGDGRFSLPARVKHLAIAHDVLIRPAGEPDIPGIAKVHVDAWRETYKGIVPDGYLAGLSYEKREQSWQRILNSPGDRADLVAVDPAHGVVGFASATGDLGPTGTRSAELRAIYVLRSHQRMGIGGRLVSAVAKKLGALGYRPVVVWVLKDNPSCAFYEALGGKLLGSKEIDIGSATLLEVQYGWDDIRELEQNRGFGVRRL